MDKETNPVLEAVEGFLKTGSAGGILLLVAAILAVICANTPLEPYYELLLSTPVSIQIGAFIIAKPLLLWINDGLMVVFFFVVGLELKRNVLEGELSDRRNIILPGAGAIGGMIVPALIYLYFNHDDPDAAHGWAIPTATDIAFALGVLTLFGSRVPASIKIFLMSLAIFDDVGAIIIIAMFYTDNISFLALVVSGICVILLAILNRNRVMSIPPYILLGSIMWAATLKSGVHATLAGVILAMFIPLGSTKRRGQSPLKELEHDLHPVVAFFVLPTFAFANAGINLVNIGTEQLLHPIPIGIALGLVVGKQLGIFVTCWLFIKMKLTQLPRKMTWLSLYGTSMLCGIGFTMSLFIGSLAFQHRGSDVYVFDERLGIIIGSLISGLLGYLILNACLPKGKKYSSKRAAEKNIFIPKNKRNK